MTDITARLSTVLADRYTIERELGARGEAADVRIALVLFCDRIGVGLTDAMRDKIEVNRLNYPAESVRGRWERPLK